MEFTYKFTIIEENQEKANEMAKALNVIYRNVSKKDLLWVAERIDQDPKVINKVIKMANNPIVKNLFDR